MPPDYLGSACVLWCVAVCCSVLPCVAVCVAVCSLLSQLPPTYVGSAVCCSLLQCVLECVALFPNSLLTMWGCVWGVGVEGWIVSKRDYDIPCRFPHPSHPPPPCLCPFSAEKQGVGNVRMWYGDQVCCSVLQCVGVCCSVLKCVAVCCSVLQCVAVCCSVLQCVAVWCSVVQRVAESCTVLLSVAECGRVLQSDAEICSVLQCVAWGRSDSNKRVLSRVWLILCDCVFE